STSAGNSCRRGVASPWTKSVADRPNEAACDRRPHGTPHRNALLTTPIAYGSCPPGRGEGSLARRAPLARVRFSRQPVPHVLLCAVVSAHAAATSPGTHR